MSNLNIFLHWLKPLNQTAWGDHIAYKKKLKLKDMNAWLDDKTHITHLTYFGSI